MTITKLFKNVLLLFGLGLFIASCGPDPVEPEENAPTAFFLQEDGFLTSDATLSINDTIWVKLKATPSGNDLNTLEIFEDGILLSTDRIIIDGDGASSNAILLFSPDTDGFTKEIGILMHTETGITKSYGFTIKDTKGLNVNLSLDITSESLPPILTSNVLDFGSMTPGGFMSVYISGTVGAALLDRIEVNEDGVAIDVSRLFFESFTTQFDSNPYTLTDAEDKDGFENINLLIAAHNDESQKVYSIILYDEDGNASEPVEFNVSVTIGIPVNIITGALLNQGGAAGTGGLDLDSGAGTGSSDSDSEIRDMGIDNSLPLSENWRQQIAGINGSIVKYIIPGQGGIDAAFTYDDIENKGDLADLFTNGVDFTQNVNGFSASNALNIGDMLIVNHDENYYFLLVTDITITDNDNLDQYTFTIKK